MNYKHGFSKHQLYSVWRNIKTRVFNDNTHNFSNYGGKGVSICDEWVNDAASFIKWCLNNGYKKGLTLDRKDPSKGYYPENCRWTELFVQQRNKGKYAKTKCNYTGVYPVIRGAFKASIRVNNKQIHIGCFSSEIEAASARDNFILSNNLIGYRLQIK